MKDNWTWYDKVAGRPVENEVWEDEDEEEYDSDVDDCEKDESKDEKGLNDK